MSAIEIVLTTYVFALWALFIYQLNRSRSLARENADLQLRNDQLSGDYWLEDGEPCDHPSRFGRRDGLWQCVFCGITFGSLATIAVVDVDPTKPCIWCGGHGLIRDLPCESCIGSGSYTSINEVPSTFRGESS